MTTTWNEDRFYRARRSYRRRVIPRLVALIVVFAGGYSAVAAYFDSRAWWWGAGLISGLALSALAFLGLFAPEHLRRRERGLLGERKTRKVLRALERDGWRVRHGVDVGRGDLDHVLTGPSGVYIVDTKTLLGQVSVERGVLVTRQEDDPDEIWRWRGLSRRMRSLAVEVSGWIRSDADVRTWVQPVVVIWGDFPQRCIETNGVVYVHGNELLAWLRKRPPRRDETDFDET